MTDQSTKRPWKNEGKLVKQDRDGITNEIALCDLTINARLIVQAVNAYDQNQAVIKELKEALEDCQKVLEVYINGNNPNSPYKDGKHSCYVLGAKEALNESKQALSKAQESPESDIEQARRLVK